MPAVGLVCLSVMGRFCGFLLSFRPFHSSLTNYCSVPLSGFITYRDISLTCKKWQQSIQWLVAPKVRCRFVRRAEGDSQDKRDSVAKGGGVSASEHCGFSPALAGLENATVRTLSHQRLRSYVFALSVSFYLFSDGSLREDSSSLQQQQHSTVTCPASVCAIPLCPLNTLIHDSKA